jgi:hypothetical protein
MGDGMVSLTLSPGLREYFVDRIAALDAPGWWRRIPGWRDEDLWDEWIVLDRSLRTYDEFVADEVEALRCLEVATLQTALAPYQL